MPRTIEGTLSAEGLKVAIVVSRFNSFITDRLLEGALDALQRHGARDGDITVVRAPGAFEIPAVLARIVHAESSDGCPYDAVICLGAVIRGATPHFDFVAAEVSKGVAAVSLESTVPVAYGILTTDSIEQAIERAGTKAGNKGFDAAQAAIEMASLFRQLD